MGAIASQITSLTIVYSTVYSDADQRKKGPRHWPLCGEFTGDRWIPRTNAQKRGKFPFDDVVMCWSFWWNHCPAMQMFFRNMKLWISPWRLFKMLSVWKMGSHIRAEENDRHFAQDNFNCNYIHFYLIPISMLKRKYASTRCSFGTAGQWYREKLQQCSWSHRWTKLQMNPIITYQYRQSFQRRVFELDSSTQVPRMST